MTAAISCDRDLQVRPANDEQPADPVLDVEDVARLLRVGRNTVYDLVGRNEIPHRRLGKQIRFSRDAVMSWLASWSSRDAKERQ
jgi:excisionase family DNA binding protein